MVKNGFVVEGTFSQEFNLGIEDSPCVFKDQGSKFFFFENIGSRKF